MKNKKKTTIFKQLIIRIIVPAILGLVVLAIFNNYQTNKSLKESIAYKNQIIENEIKNILELQDVTLDILEQSLDSKMKALSNKIVNNYFSGDIDPKKMDLDKIRDELEIDSLLGDIYIINNRGIVVNTTFEKDMNLNFFNFGEKHKNLLLKILKEGRFVSERFAIEAKTRRLKKYTYQPTLDGKYIVELGMYSKRADKIIDFVRKRLKNFAKENKSVLSVELFIGGDKYFSLNKANAEALSEKHKSIMEKVFDEKQNHSFYIEEMGKKLHYEYIYMSRNNTNLYKSSVIRIKTDRTGQIKSLKSKLIWNIFFFGILILAIVILLYLNTKLITKPIKKLNHNINRISEGFLKERAEVVGNNEITNLAEQYNAMLDQIENYYNELENANTQLEYLNDTLELRIEAEVKHNREKDLILSQQSGMLALSELTENLSLKWQKPLYQINRMIQQIQEDFERGKLTGEEINEKVVKTQSSIKYLSQSLHDFKFFFIPDKEMQSFSLKDVTEKAISLLKPNLEKYKVEVEVDVPEDLYITGYPSEFTQAVINILNNSNDVIMERNVTNPLIKIDTETQDDKTIYKIRDNAGGIPDVIIDSLFEPYVSTKEGDEGTGLGLYITKMIIENKMEGTIEAGNTEYGAEFRIII